MTEQDRRNEIKLLTEKQRQLIQDVVKLEYQVEYLTKLAEQFGDALKAVTDSHCTVAETVHDMWGILKKSGIFTKEALEMMEKERTKDND